MFNKISIQTAFAQPIPLSACSGKAPSRIYAFMFQRGSKLCGFIVLIFKIDSLIFLSARRFIGVADIASVRFSLPAQLLEPTPNLEYWNYLDQPNTFIAIGDSDDALDRMLEVLRFWFTKDLKYVKKKPCKPYNSTLGEFFRVREVTVGSWVATD